MEGCRPSQALVNLATCGGSLDVYRALVVAGEGIIKLIKLKLLTLFLLHSLTTFFSLPFLKTLMSIYSKDYVALHVLLFSCLLDVSLHVLLVGNNESTCPRAEMQI